MLSTRTIKSFSIVKIEEYDKTSWKSWNYADYKSYTELTK